MRAQVLEKLIAPESLAVFCDDAQPGTAGAELLQTLVADFSGPITLVCPRAPQELPNVVGHSPAASVNADLAILLLPAKRLPSALRSAAESGCGAALLLAPEDAEHQPRPRNLLSELADLSSSYDMPLLGPDSLGLLRPEAGLYACVARGSLRPGRVALLTRSRGFGSALMDWATTNDFGFSLLAAPGDIGVDEGELLDFLSIDPRTRGVLLYMDRVRDARRFISGLRATARVKPVVVLKSGRSDLDTGRELSQDRVFDAAIARAGAVRVNTVHQLFTAARALMAGVRVFGSRLAVVSNAAGPATMAADRAVRRGVQLVPPSPETLATLRATLPAPKMRGPIVDLLGDASPERYAASCGHLLRDRGNDALLVLFTPQQRSDPLACAEALIRAVGERQRRPVLACWMGEGLVAAARKRLAEAGVLHFTSPERCLDAFSYLATYERHQLALMQAPPPQPVRAPADVAGARLIIEEALSERHRVLSAAEATAVLSAFRIPVLHSLTVHSSSEALVAAETLGLPVTLHVNDVEGVRDPLSLQRDVRDAAAVRTAFRELRELLQSQVAEGAGTGIALRRLREDANRMTLQLAVELDPEFGPVIHLSRNAARDSGALALPPLNLFLARDLVSRALGDDPAAQLPEREVAEDALLETLMRVSEMCCVLPELQALEIAPLELSTDGVCAATVMLRVAPRRATTRRYGHMAIHPYPAGMETRWQLPDGRNVTIRPMRPEDAALEQAFVEGLSEESRYNRFMYRLEKLTPTMLARFTQIDYDREMALAVFLTTGEADTRQLAVARYVSNPDGQSCEFALTVADDMQGQGIGRKLMQGLLDAARDRGLEVMEGEVLASNRRMLRLCEGLGFRLLQGGEDPEVVSVRRHL